MIPKNSPHSCHCSCCAVNHRGLNRRDFLFRVGAVGASTLMLPGMELLAGDKPGPLLLRGPQAPAPLKVQPVLTHDLPKRKEATSWRNWGGVQTEEAASAEKERITAELSELKKKSDFPLEILPVATARTVEQAGALASSDCDTVLVYAAGGDLKVLETLITPKKSNLMFLRHDPGPVYLWYEIVHPRFLRKMVDQYALTGLKVNDVVVDEHAEILWRLRALYGLKRTLGKRVLAIGGAGGWGAGGQKAPDISRTLWKMDLIDYPYEQLEPRLKAARKNADLVKRCEAAAARYLGQARLSLHTRRSFIDNAFLLTEVMKDLMEEAKTDALTIEHCMGTIMGISETTACLPLSMLNDEGFLAFCESDFVVIPSGVLLHYISGLPVFLNDPTVPHKNIVTLAHCTAPRKMDGKRAERTKIYTHFESDYGAAPKVEMKLGQVCTNLVPDFDCLKWTGFKGKIVGNPFLDICRSQIEVKIDGDCERLLQDMKGFHWMMSYGDYMRETGYALNKLGIEFQNVSVRTL